MGPDGTFYEDGCFRALLSFPRDYPLSPVCAGALCHSFSSLEGLRRRIFVLGVGGGGKCAPPEPNGLYRRHAHTQHPGLSAVRT